MTEPESAAAKYAYDRQSIWSQTADRLKAGPARQRTWRLGLTVAAAALALAGSQAKSVSTPASAALALAPYTLGVTAGKRDLPAVTDVETYLAIRVRESQLAGYYLPKAAAMKRRVDRLKVVEVTLALVAAGLAAVAITSASVAAWAAVATTASGAVAAYIAAERFEFLWIEYSRTGVQLQRLLDLHKSGDPTAPAGPDLAAACEEVISIQNQAWMAKWGEEGDDFGGDTARG